MASTNKTTHYNLSQYVGSDKPTYLVDYNTDMSNIDAGIYSAKSEADNNASAIGDLTELETSVKTDLVSAINEEKEKTDNIGNLSNLTTEANTNLVSAINEVDAHTDTNNQNIGTMTNLETTVKTSLVGAINELNSKIGNLSSLDTTDKTNLVNAINEVFNREKGTILWTNPNPSVDFTAQNITLSSSDYDMYEVIFVPSLGTTQEQNAGRVKKGTGTRMSSAYTASDGVGCRMRTIDYVNDTTLTINDGYETKGTSPQSISNGVCIPLYIIGHKTGLFN